MSNNFCNLNSYVSQRLLSLFETLAKKYHRLEITLKTNMVKINSETRENDDGEKENSFVEMGKNSTTSQSKPNEENSVKETIINGTHETDKEDTAIQIKSSTDLDVKNLSGDEAVINVDDNASSDIVSS